MYWLVWRFLLEPHPVHHDSCLYSLSSFSPQELPVSGVSSCRPDDTPYLSVYPPVPGSLQQEGELANDWDWCKGEIKLTCASTMGTPSATKMLIIIQYTMCDMLSYPSRYVTACVAVLCTPWLLCLIPVSTRPTHFTISAVLENRRIHPSCLKCITIRTYTNILVHVYEVQLT